MDQKVLDKCFFSQKPYTKPLKNVYIILYSYLSNFKTVDFAFSYVPSKFSSTVTYLFYLIIISAAINKF